jgi:hypothetical protein
MAEAELPKLAVMHQYKMEEAAAAAQAKAANPSGRPVGGPQLSIQNARQIMLENSEPYLDQDGNAIDIASLPDNMGMKEFFLGNKSWWVPFSPNAHFGAVGNYVYAFDPMAPTANPTPLGIQRPGTTSQNIGGVTYLDDDPTSKTYGKWVQSGGERVTTPNTPGLLPSAMGGGVPPPPTPAPVIGTGNAAVPTGISAHAPNSSKSTPTPVTPKTATGSTAPKGTMSRVLGGTPASQVNYQQRRNTAINVAGQGLQQFAQPGPDGISDLDLFKDPKAVERIANYLRLNNQLIEGSYDAAEKGGIDTVFSFYAGIPQTASAASTGALRDQYSELTDRDKKFVSDYYSLLGQWGGMRSATGASASKYNFLNLSQEIPNPININSYSAAVGKVRNNIHELNGIAAPNTKARTYSEDEILPPKKTSSPVPPPPGAAAKTYKHYAKNANGHRIGTDDDPKDPKAVWYDTTTGQKVN